MPVTDTKPETKLLAKRLAGKYVTLRVSSLNFLPEDLNAIHIETETVSAVPVSISYGAFTSTYLTPFGSQAPEEEEYYKTRVSVVGYNRHNGLVVQFATQDCGVSITSFDWTRLAPVDSMFCWTCSIEDIVEDNAPNIKDEFPHKCLYCGAAALILFRSLECSNSECACYKYKE